MTPSLSAVYHSRRTGSGQFLEPGQVYLSPGFAKIAPWWLASRDSLVAKEPGPVAGWTSPPTLSAHTRNRQPVQKPALIVNNLSSS